MSSFYGNGGGSGGGSGSSIENLFDLSDRLAKGTITDPDTGQVSEVPGAVIQGAVKEIITDRYALSSEEINIASGVCSHAEGGNTIASENYSHAEGASTEASGDSSHAEGGDTIASGTCSHAEGDGTTASGLASHAEGNRTEASGNYSHTQGYGTSASDQGAHAEGAETEASGLYSHAEGSGTIASGDYSHAEGGQETTASGDYSHAEGYNTVATHQAQHVFGMLNISDPSQNSNSQKGTYVQIVGNGEDQQRSNARTLDWNGNEKLAGSLTLGMGTQNETTITAAQLASLKELIGIESEGF